MPDHALTYRLARGQPVVLYGYLGRGPYYGHRGEAGRREVARRLLAELREQHGRATVWLDGHRVNGVSQD